LTLTTSLTDQSQRNQVWDVLRRITDRVDDGDASHLQLVVKLILHEDQANGIAEAARQAGVNPTITHLD
jgi:peptide deformylase